jgi:DNA-binding transcriptional LysR family regulator
MEIDHIETFLAIVQLGGFTRAGTRVHRSQPAISRRLRMLEAELGAPLFERIRGVVRLTDVGRAFLPHARAMLAAHHDALESVRTLAAVGTVLDARLCTRLKEFRVTHPEVRLRVKTASSEQVSQLVRQGDATLGVRYFDDASADVTTRPLGAERMVVIAAAEHPLLAKTSASLEQLAAETWLGFPTSKAYKEAFGRLLRMRLDRAGLERVEIMEVDSTQAQKRLVEAGFGLALLPHSAVAPELTSGTLKIVRAPRIATRIPLTLIMRKHAFLSPAARALSELVAVGAASLRSRSATQSDRRDGRAPRRMVEM